MATGAHTVNAVATDSAGASTNLAYPVTITVTANTPPMGHLEQVAGSNGSTTLAQNTTLTVAGWTADQEDGAPVSHVQIQIDGQAVGNATLGGARPDVAAYFGDSRYTNS